MKKRICLMALTLVALVLFSMPLFACRGPLENTITQNEARIAHLEYLIENTAKYDEARIAELEELLRQAREAYNNLKNS
ncbi:MAG: hypothetical protein FWD86_03780 [Firmicutes bacterium]|nr:hypothetical protein [Bacillota bacterium]